MHLSELVKVVGDVLNRVDLLERHDRASTEARVKLRKELGELEARIELVETGLIEPPAGGPASTTPKATGKK